MTTERIDHVTHANDLLDVGGEQLGVDEFAYADLSFQSAQVHATLALVEQQRIANLIAILANAARSVAEGTATASGYADLYSKINPQIQEGLGIS